VPRADWPELSQRLASAAESIGLHDIKDQNGVFTDGHFAPAYTNENQQRVSAAMAYLTASVRGRPNLTILTDSLVVGIDFDGKRAIGIDYEIRGRRITARGDEIILALGALQTPAMLMRAGIGPANTLKQHGITPRAVREGVGQNLRDHPGTHLCALVKSHARMPKRLKKSGHVALRFTSSTSVSLPSDLYMHSGVSSAWHGVGQRVAYFYLWLNKSRSTGEVTLRDADPYSMPAVRMNLLGTDGDAERLADGFRIIAGLLRDPEMVPVIEHPFAVRFSPFIRRMSQVRRSNKWIMGALGRLLDGPTWLRGLLVKHVLSNAPSIDTLLSDPARLKSYLKHHAMSVSHVTCTCRIGRPDDPLAVVDPDGLVYGVESLRIVDASVMPSLPRANTNSVTMMIAEKISDAIRRNRTAGSVG
jgi:5-(hydroxymethyl)furfural/furfural oxidase